MQIHLVESTKEACDFCMGENKLAVPLSSNARLWICPKHLKEFSVIIETEGGTKILLTTT
jgi:hypothetical protein